MAHIRTFLILTMGLIALTPAWADNDAITGKTIRMLGLEAWLHPELRDTRVQELAGHMVSLSAARVHELQGDFQFALLLQVDVAIYDTLAPSTIEAIDDALEDLFDFNDIDRDNEWEPLVYLYGFFNRDVTPKIIQEVLGTWDALSDREKASRYPTYIHVIDAVTKPISMGPLDATSTRAALELVVPALKNAFLAPPKPGTAFHPPSHACLVLGPLYERWVEHPEFGPLIKQHLGARKEFEALLASQLVGDLGEAPISHVTYGYHAYIGAYLANALARLNARTAVPALNRSMAIYEDHNARGRVMKYTQRALLALGAPEARTDFENALKDPAMRADNIKTAVWMARNGQGETQTYGLEKLGALLNCPPVEALETYFQAEYKRAAQ